MNVNNLTFHPHNLKLLGILMNTMVKILLKNEGI